MPTLRSAPAIRSGWHSAGRAVERCIDFNAPITEIETHRDAHRGATLAEELSSADDATAEGAVAEAVMWDFLDNRGLHIELADPPGKGGPDFLCRRGERCFYVEVTNISRAVVTKKTGLQEHLSGARHYALLTGQIKRKVIDKSGQLHDMAAPLLVAVTTLHSDATQLCIRSHHIQNLLYSDPGVSWNVNLHTGEASEDAHQTTDMGLSLFTHAKSTRVTRRHLSGVLACGLGLRPPKAEVLGVLHPEPLHAFSPDLLIDVPFCSFEEWPPGNELRVRWSGLRRT